MTAEIKVPEVGESISEGVLVAWLKEDGDQVAVDDGLFELETDKISLTVPAEQAGRLSIGVEAGSKVKVGQVVGRIDPQASGEATQEAGPAQAAPSAPAKPREQAPQPAAPPPPAPAAPTDQQQGPPISAPAGLPQAAEKLSRPQDLEQLSPAVRRLVTEHQLDPRQVAASGPSGRLTKEDVVRHLERTPEPAAPAQPEPAAREQSKGQPTAAPPPARPAPPPPASDRSSRQTRRPMSSLRQRIAERLLAAQQNAAILTTFNEVDMSQLMALRARFKEPFQKRHGVNLGMMSFFVKAAVEALQSVPTVNAQIQGDEIVENHYYDIGVAVGTEQGLVVPVLRDVDQLSFAQIEAAIRDFAERARTRKLQLHELSGGTFTISNGGVYGSMLSTPILNPPQSGILGMHGIKKRAVVLDDQIVIRPMMYLALSYDHRLVDGQEAVTCLKRVVECIENPERLLLEV